MRKFVAEENVRRFEALLRDAGTPEQRRRLEELLAGAQADLQALEEPAGDEDSVEDA